MRSQEEPGGETRRRRGRGRGRGHRASSTTRPRRTPDPRAVCDPDHRPPKLRGGPHASAPRDACTRREPSTPPEAAAPHPHPSRTPRSPRTRRGRLQGEPQGAGPEQRRGGDRVASPLTPLRGLRGVATAVRAVRFVRTERQRVPTRMRPLEGAAPTCARARNARPRRWPGGGVQRSLRGAVTIGPETVDLIDSWRKARPPK